MGWGEHSKSHSSWRQHQPGCVTLATAQLQPPPASQPRTCMNDPGAKQTAAPPRRAHASSAPCSSSQSGPRMVFVAAGWRLAHTECSSALPPPLPLPAACHRRSARAASRALLAPPCPGAAFHTSASCTCAAAPSAAEPPPGMPPLPLASLPAGSGIASCGSTTVSWAYRSWPSPDASSYGCTAQAATAASSRRTAALMAGWCTLRVGGVGWGGVGGQVGQGAAECQPASTHQQQRPDRLIEDSHTHTQAGMGVTSWLPSANRPISARPPGPGRTARRARRRQPCAGPACRLKPGQPSSSVKKRWASRSTGGASRLEFRLQPEQASKCGQPSSVEQAAAAAGGAAAALLPASGVSCCCVCCCRRCSLCRRCCLRRRRCLGESVRGAGGSGPAEADARQAGGNLSIVQMAERLHAALEAGPICQQRECSARLSRGGRSEALRRLMSFVLSAETQEPCKTVL